MNYDVPGSGVYVKVVKIYFKHEKYVKAKIEIRHKVNNMLGQKLTVKLKYDMINHWREYEKK